MTNTSAHTPQAQRIRHTARDRLNWIRLILE